MNKTFWVFIVVPSIFHVVFNFTKRPVIQQSPFEMNSEVNLNYFWYYSYINKLVES